MTRPAVVVPAPAAVRAYRRRVLRARGRSALRSALGATWDVLVAAAVLGGIGVQAGRRLVGGFPAHRDPAAAGTAAWLLAAVAVALLGAALRGLVAAGPLSAQPAALTWMLSAPVDRAGLLLPRFWLSAAGSLVAGAVVGAVLPLPAAGPPGTVVAGAAAGGLLALAAYGAVAAGQARPGIRWSAVGTALLVAAAAGGLVVAVLGLAGRSLPAVPATAVLAAVAVLAVVAAVAGLVRARAGLGRLERGTLAAGGALVAGVATSVTWLDAGLLRGVADERRWRTRATVRSRRLTGTGPAVLVRADLRRLARRPGRLIGWAALAVVPYVVAAVAAPVWVAAGQVLAGALAVSLLTPGLRAVADQPGLRRALGLEDRQLLSLHALLPAAGAFLWAAVTAPALAAVAGSVPGGAAGEPAVGASVAAAIGAVAAATRAATRPPVNYDAAVSPDVGFGAAPVGLIAQLVRGADIALVLAGLALAGAPFTVRAAVAVFVLAWSLRAPTTD
ncbi:MAG TPA: DUF6297 family protein [Mycobacteriales bacterium]